MKQTNNVLLITFYNIYIFKYVYVYSIVTHQLILFLILKIYENYLPKDKPTFNIIFTTYKSV